jgi:predicted enzyme related to lactoylglutathione lyase
MQYKIQGMTMSITNMETMLDFYMNMFNMTFVEKKMNGNYLYSTTWSGLDLLFIPAELTKIQANQNRHQIDVIVEDIEKVIDTALKFGGRIIGKLVEDENSKSVGVYDPDGNSILFVEMMN